MALAVLLELELVERQPDRVYVSVVLTPEAEAPAALDGVALQLFSRAGDSLGPRLLLPIAGTLAQTMVSTVELRGRNLTLPPGGRVVGTVWLGADQAEATCPTDPWTELQAHVRGTRPVIGRSDADLELLTPAERDVLTQAFPWLEPPPLTALPGDVLEDEGANLDDLCSGLGLDPDEAEFLKSLLTEE